MKAWPLIAACALLATACHPTASSAPVARSRAEPHTKSVLYVVDHSGSMAREMPAIRDWIRDQTLASAGNGDQFRVALLGERSFGRAMGVPALEIPRTGRMFADRQALHQSLRWWTQAASDSLRKLPVDNRTDVVGALCEASNLLASDRDRYDECVLVLLSDLLDNRQIVVDTTLYRLDGVRVLIAFAAQQDGDPHAYARRVRRWTTCLSALGASEVQCLDAASTRVSRSLLPVGHRH